MPQFFPGHWAIEHRGDFLVDAVWLVMIAYSIELSLIIRAINAFDGAIELFLSLFGLPLALFLSFFVALLFLAAGTTCFSSLQLRPFGARPPARLSCLLRLEAWGQNIVIIFFLVMPSLLALLLSCCFRW
jgi:hypothetical protein